MSAWAARRRHEQRERERELISLRGSVTAAVVAQAPSAGSSAIADAVDEALAQLVAADRHLGEPGQVKQTWILYAKHRIINEQQSAGSKRRAPFAIDDLAQALTFSASGDLATSTEDNRTAWRIRELLSQLRGDQRRWAEAWYDQILAGSLPPGGQPRGLTEKLGWDGRKTKSVAYRARKRMVAFANERASGAICADRRASLDDFIRATANVAEDGVRVALDQARYEQILFHLAGCEDCWAAWHARRRSLRARVGAILTLPFGWAASVLHASRAKLGPLLDSAHAGTAAAITGGGAASLSVNSVGICVGIVCAAGAGAGALVVAPSILAHAPRHASHHSIRIARAPVPIALTRSQQARAKLATRRKPRVTQAGREVVGRPDVATASSLAATTLFSSGLNAGSVLYAIAKGPDGNLWFADAGSTPAIGRITPQGTITEFSAGLNPRSHPEGIVAGPDGNIWFTDASATTPAIGQITPNGAITEFSTGLPPGSEPEAITAGPDGNMWFTDYGVGAIGRITPGGQITEFTNGTLGRYLFSIAAGPDGDLWVANAAGGDSQIDRIGTAGAITQFSAGLQPGLSAVDSIAAGSDGNMWFADAGGAADGGINEIGEITPGGTITEFPTPGNVVPGLIAAGPDGNMWFNAEGGSGALGRVTPSGTISFYAIRAPDALDGLVAGPDGNLWGSGGGRILRYRVGQQ